MTTVDSQNSTQTPPARPRRARLFTRINAADKWFQVLGLSWITPVLRAAAGDNPRAQMKEIWRLLIGAHSVDLRLPAAVGHRLAPKVQTSLGCGARPRAGLGGGGQPA